ncbi:unnamed protein product [Cyprideis torosa]|uniref:Uncharacterized protein n=1 Tax=Cyprideis torosa TaxID=163714 RepID=A0A7R8ZRN0_9CRUS|nr:unnamed protein product [Cyprideis torosa]CAG0894396.1 unnamed protein product [Cyprideis torosa]
MAVDFIPRIMCPANYVAVGEKCYSFQNEMEIWDEARERCKDDDLSAGDLLMLETRNEAELITYYLQQKYGPNCAALPRAWIGAVKAAEGDFTYHWGNESGHTVFETSGINWKPGAPQCTDFACAAYLECASEFQWGDEFRYVLEIEGFICEHEALASDMI